jgi:uncharacterized PurR-regulated membrane protein YhhQ (DUF165 family)
MQRQKSIVILILAILIYAVSMTLGNLIVAKFGAVITPINGFLLIGLDLSLRDWLHVQLKPSQLGALIMVAGLLTYGLDHSTEQIAIANTSAFTLAALADWFVFSRLRRGSWLVRSNTSNIVGSAVDSLVFPTLAFGTFLPAIVMLQFLAKTAGGAFWTWIINRRRGHISQKESRAEQLNS